MDASVEETSARALLEAEVARARWYHTIELSGGVVTPGEYDLRPALERVPLPGSLAGMRCLDVGTRDGFWAFEMERRGAAEVVAIDLADPERLDWPEPRPRLSAAQAEELEARGRTFQIAARALGSRVEQRELSVYELDRARVGEFDFAVIGTLLLHLRNPVDALMSIRRVLAGGELLVNEPIMLSLSLNPFRRGIPTAVLMGQGGMPFWWIPNAAGLRREVEAAGYEIGSSGGPYLLPIGRARQAVPLRDYRRGGWATLVDWIALRRGMPHAWVLARPRTD